MPLLLILFSFKQKFVKKRLITFILLAGFAAAISYGLYSILRLSPLYSMINIKNATFVYPISEWIHHPFVYFFSNLNGLTSWLLQYLTPSYLILILVAILFINKFLKEKVLLLLYFALPFMALALFGKLIYPRHMFLMSVMLLPLVAWSLNFLFEEAERFFAKNKIYVKATQVILLLVVIAYPLFISVIFAVNPSKAPIADADHGQYVNGWAAGWGVKESVTFFENQAKDKKIFVATAGTFGLMPESMELYMISNKNILPFRNFLLISMVLISFLFKVLRQCGQYVKSILNRNYVFQNYR